jgi:hypothetical protein
MNNIINDRNVFLYWEGEDNSLISILRKLIYLHSKSGKGYKVHLINHKNIHEYVSDLPSCFFNMKLAHQADYVRVNVVCDYGGIWLDSDTIVIESLDSLFDYLETNSGFFILEETRRDCRGLCNGIFGSRANTKIMREWKERVKKMVPPAFWSAIGAGILQAMQRETPELYKDYHIFTGKDNMYPVHFSNCKKAFLSSNYENYKGIVREYQPLVIIIGQVYRELSDKTEEEIMNSKLVINYFLNLSLENGNKK